MKLYAVLTEMDYDGLIVAPSYISTNLESLKNFIKNDTIIGCIDTDSKKYFKTFIDLENGEKFQEFYTIIYGKTTEYFWKNKITGELRKWISDENDMDWEDGFLCRRYDQGKIVEKWFE